MASRKFPVDELCLNCHRFPETTIHALWGYSTLRVVRTSISFVKGVCFKDSVHFFNFFLSCIRCLDQHELGIMCLLLWRIWFHRNQVVHSLAPIKLASCFSWAQEFLVECSAIADISQKELVIQAANSKWRAPEPGGLVEDFEKYGRGEYEIDSGSESETFDDDFIELEYEEIERWGNEDQWDDEGEKGLDLVVMEDKETGLDDEGEKRLDHSVAMDDEHKQAMKKLKRMNRNKWKMKKPTFEQFNMESDLRTVKLKVGQIFGNAKLFKEAAREYAINQGRSIWFPCNEKSRVQGVCKCKLDNCSWSIWASCYEKNSPSSMIKTLNDKHTCPRVQKNRLANSTWLAKRYTEDLRPGKEFKMFDFLGNVRKDYVCQPSKTQVYRAKRKAGLLTEGSLATQYAKLWDYADEIRRSNPGSTVVIDVEEGLDKLDDDFGITFMTDKQKGLVEAIGELWKNSEHRNCV
ncbi:hypothetical protein LWI29_015595 [Acer saccharum]|uniref:Transposase MuDR plant domain-containing protein n=1 Tax=Acer saccharum TaxID=4024 RepID=A0AA39TKT9_ACESA|nr:hypothetical protein LWI29_015595 [Acer saccharum]